MCFIEKGMTFERLDEHLSNAQRVGVSTDSGRFIFLSDAHKWDRTDVDRFNSVEQVYLSALKYYNEQDFSLVLLGDIEEGAGCNLSDVVNHYPRTFEAEAKFLPNRYWRVYGNHDHDWKKKEVRALLDRAMDSQVEVYPALVLGDNVMVVHGHEGDFFSDEVRGVIQIALRLFKKLFERLKRHSINTAENSRVRDRRAKLLYKWGKRNGMLIIAGHTHAAYFESISLTRLNSKLVRHLEHKVKAMPQSRLLAGERENLERKKRFMEVHDRFWKKNRSLPRGSLPLYFNTGCCKYDDGLTGIEIAEGNISLVKWTSASGSDPKREILASRRISRIVNGIMPLIIKRRNRRSRASRGARGSKQ
jgi:UDP-2,3-diacylglucosamine pyrophosphatase LpxH